MLLPRSLFTPPPNAPPDVRFRLATQADLVRLHTAFYAHQTGAEFRNYSRRLLRRQRTDNCFWLIAVLSETLIGNGQLIIYPHGAEIANLGVISSCQGRGVGSALILVLTNIARHVGLSFLEIGAADTNTRALALYRRLGFVEDRRVQLPNGEPSVVLRKAL